MVKVHPNRLQGVEKGKNGGCCGDCPCCKFFYDCYRLHKVRKRDFLRELVDQEKEKHKKKYLFVTYVYDIFMSLTTYGDIISDIFATRALVKAGHIWWTYLQITFIAIPVVITSCRILYRLKQSNVCFSVLIFMFSPIFIIILDIMRPMVTIFKFWLRDVLPDFFMFLDIFGGVRDRSTVIFESIPQLILQVYIYFYCTNPNNKDCGLELDDNTSLVLSIGFSLFDIGTGLYTIYSNAKNLNKSFCAYFCDIIKFGSEIPHEALHDDTIREYTLDKNLSARKYGELTTLLGQNKSLIKITIRDFEIKSDKFKMIVEGLRTSKCPLVCSG